MKVIQKLHQMNLTDMLKDISEAMQNSWDTRCLCEVIWSDVLNKDAFTFKKFCKESRKQYDTCDYCHQKCLEALMEKDIR